MANINPLALAIGTSPPGNMDPDTFGPMLDLYVQIGVLVKQYNIRHGVLQSPNGHYWRVSVSDAGVLSTTDLGLVLS